MFIIRINDLSYYSFRYQFREIFCSVNYYLLIVCIITVFILLLLILFVLFCNLFSFDYSFWNFIIISIFNNSIGLLYNGIWGWYWELTLLILILYYLVIFFFHIVHVIEVWKYFFSFIIIFCFIFIIRFWFWSWGLELFSIVFYWYRIYILIPI